MIWLLFWQRVFLGAALTPMIFADAIAEDLAETLKEDASC